MMGCPAAAPTKAGARAKGAIGTAPAMGMLAAMMSDLIWLVQAQRKRKTHEDRLAVSLLGRNTHESMPSQGQFTVKLRTQKEILSFYANKICA